jgi:hypothetical protein
MNVYEWANNYDLLSVSLGQQSTYLLYDWTHIQIYLFTQQAMISKMPGSLMLKQFTEIYMVPSNIIEPYNCIQSIRSLQ